MSDKVFKQKFYVNIKIHDINEFFVEILTDSWTDLVLD